MSDTVIPPSPPVDEDYLAQLLKTDVTDVLIIFLHDIKVVLQNNQAAASFLRDELNSGSVHMEHVQKIIDALDQWNSRSLSRLYTVNEFARRSKGKDLTPADLGWSPEKTAYMRSIFGGIAEDWDDPEMDVYDDL